MARGIGYIQNEILRQLCKHAGKRYFNARDLNTLVKPAIWPEYYYDYGTAKTFHVWRRNEGYVKLCADYPLDYFRHTEMLASIRVKLHNAMKGLVKRGYIARHVEAKTFSRPAYNVYSITEAGKQYFESTDLCINDCEHR